jgi:hypothetical protein
MQPATSRLEIAHKLARGRRPTVDTEIRLAGTQVRRKLESSDRSLAWDERLCTAQCYRPQIPAMAVLFETDGRSYEVGFQRVSVFGPYESVMRAGDSRGPAGARRTYPTVNRRCASADRL